MSQSLFPAIKYERITVKVTTGAESPIVYHGPVTAMTPRQVLKAINALIEKAKP